MLSTTPSGRPVGLPRGLQPLVWLALLLLAGCAPSPERPDIPPPMDDERLDPMIERPEAPAEDTLQRAQELAYDAAYAEGEERIAMQLQAAEFYIDAGELELAGRILHTLVRESVTPRQLRQWRLLTARLELALRHPRDALYQLRDLPDDVTTPEQNEAIHRLRARAHSALGNFIEVARSRVAMDDYLDADGREANQRAIWTALQRPRESQLQRLVAEPGDIFGGWVQLARHNKGHQYHPVGLGAALDAWESLYPEHPAASLIVPELRSRKSDDFRHPEQVTVLLPLSGRFSSAGHAIRDSMLAGYYFGRQQGRAANTTLRFLDTHEADPVELVEAAVVDGADFIVGPLLRDGLETLMAALADGFDPGVPILALNEVDGDRPRDQFFRFGLNPENEARAVAERMWRDGHTRVIMLRPRGNWGERVESAFELHWQALGGELLAGEPYGEEATNLSLPIRRVLAVDLSQQRSRDLRQRLGARLHVESRRRQDIEAIFLAGFPDTSRQIPPQLSFYDAGDLPVYGTSHLYSGSPDAAMDRDLHGVQFSDMPWLLIPGEDRLNPRYRLVDHTLEPDAGLRRLHAFGLDAWELIPRLQLLAEQPHERMDGATGTLYVDHQGRVGRELLWGRFERGRPTTLDYSDD